MKLKWDYSLISYSTFIDDIRPLMMIYEMSKICLNHFIPTLQKQLKTIFQRNFKFQVGMRNYHVRRNKEFCPVLNLDKLWTLVSEQSRLKYAGATDGKVPVINIVKAVSIPVKVTKKSLDCLGKISCINVSKFIIDRFLLVILSQST